jgi:hypothetical protein
MFPIVFRLIKLALILPVTTTYVEWAFSAMNIIKTDLQNGGLIVWYCAILRRKF